MFYRYMILRSCDVSALVLLVFLSSAVSLIVLNYHIKNVHIYLNQKDDKGKKGELLL